MAFELPALPYAYDALEPVIDADTMRFHHDKHHATYVANLNKALEAHPELFERSVEFLIAHLLLTRSSKPSVPMKNSRNSLLLLPQAVSEAAGHGSSLTATSLKFFPLPTRITR